MASDPRWLVYQPDDRRRPAGIRGRRWPWLLLLLLLLIVLAAIAAWFWNENSGEAADVDLARRVDIQVALPALLAEQSMTIYVVDDSGSMDEKLPALRRALRKLADEAPDDSRVAVLRFEAGSQLLVDFTEPAEIDWDEVASGFTARGIRTEMYAALQMAMDTLPDEEVCEERSRLIFLDDTVCFENRIVLMTDGEAWDPELFFDTLEALLESDITVDTIAFSTHPLAEADLKMIAEMTDGRFVQAYH